MQQAGPAYHWDCVQRSYQWYGILDLINPARADIHGDETGFGFPFGSCCQAVAAVASSYTEFTNHIMAPFVLKCWIQLWPHQLWTDCQTGCLRWCVWPVEGPPWLGRGWFGHLEALNTPFVFFEKGGKMANHLVRQRLPRCQSKVRSSRPILMRRCRWTVQTLARRYWSIGWNSEVAQEQGQFVDLRDLFCYNLACGVVVGFELTCWRVVDVHAKLGTQRSVKTCIPPLWWSRTSIRRSVFWSIKLRSISLETLSPALLPNFDVYTKNLKIAGLTVCCEMRQFIVFLYLRWKVLLNMVHNGSFLTSCPLASCTLVMVLPGVLFIVKNDGQNLQAAEVGLGGLQLWKGFGSLNDVELNHWQYGGQEVTMVSHMKETTVV